MVDDARFFREWGRSSRNTSSQITTAPPEDDGDRDEDDRLVELDED